MTPTTRPGTPGTCSSRNCVERMAALDVSRRMPGTSRRLHRRRGGDRRHAAAGHHGRWRSVALPKIQNELSLSDAGRSWVITAYADVRRSGTLLGGRLGDTIGRKRTFIAGVALFTIASILCGLAWDEATSATARLAQGIGADDASPTALALIATTFPKRPPTAIFAAMTGIGSVMGRSWAARDRGVLAVGVLGQCADRLADPRLRQTHRAAIRLDAQSAVLATLRPCSVFRWAGGLAVPDHHRRRNCCGGGVLGRFLLQGAQLLPAPGHVQRPQQGGQCSSCDLHGGRRGCSTLTVLIRSARPAHHGLQRAACRRGLTSRS